MKIFHTADVHLHSDQPERLAALGKIVALGCQETIDLLLIAGDLFDDRLQAQLLKGPVRRMFSNLPYQVMAIPGNHDESVYADEAFYGDSFRPLITKPYTLVDFPNWRLAAVPYAESSFSALAPELQTLPDRNKKNILILHCSWSLPHYTDEDYGGEDLRYFPVTEASLTGLGFDYILAGHFHSSYRQRRLPCGSLFVYSGSPVSITTREQGRRSINLVDLKGCRPIALDSWYYQDLEYTLKITNTEASLQQLSRELALHPDQYCGLKIRLTGYSAEQENALMPRLQDLINGRVNTTLDLSFKSANHIYGDALYQQLKSSIPPGEKADAMETMLLDAFCQIFAEAE